MLVEQNNSKSEFRKTPNGNNLENNSRIKEVQSELNLRSKSTNVSRKKIENLAPKINFEQEFNTNQNNALMQQIGFGKDFLSFPEERKKQENDFKEFSGNENFQSLDDIDFRTNNGKANVGNPFVGNYFEADFGVKKETGGDKKWSESYNLNSAKKANEVVDFIGF